MVDVDVPADAPLLRPTARARRALVWIQLGLACLVVLVAAEVGGAVQDRIDDRAGRLPDRIGVQAQAVLPEARPVHGAAPNTGGGRTVEGDEGPIAALGTLLVGWILTAAVGTVGRRRLEERENERWAAEWAGVEPVWSGRVP
jgi:hypothetical protein